jgi:hypothetical protein
MRTCIPAGLRGNAARGPEDKLSCPVAFVARLSGTNDQSRGCVEKDPFKSFFLEHKPTNSGTPENLWKMSLTLLRDP